MAYLKGFVKLVKQLYCQSKRHIVVGDKFFLSSCLFLVNCFYDRDVDGVQKEIIFFLYVYRSTKQNFILKLALFNIHK